MTNGTRRAPGGRQRAQRPYFLFGAKEASAGEEVPRHQAKVAILVQRDQDQEDSKTEVIVEPKTASPPELFAGEDRFCQDSLY